MDKNVISRLDKIQAKKLGIGVEEYKAREQTVSVIWYKLFNEGKVISPPPYITVHKGLLFVESIGVIALFNLALLIYNAIGGFGLVTKDIWITAILSAVLYIIGKLIIHSHDMRQLEKYVEEQYGKEMYFKARLRNAGERLNTIYVSDEELKQAIHMEISIED